MASRMGALGQRVRWRRDRQAGTATLEDAPPALRGYAVPLRPMLGGLGVAPDFGFAPFSAGDSGRFGGNLDYNGVVAGATVYLPVFQPGALLHLGDGHALQGDGETTQWALETSLDVEFSVEVLPPAPLATPRIESAEAITTLGQTGSLDEAVRLATPGMGQWLGKAYGLDDREFAGDRDRGGAADCDAGGAERGGGAEAAEECVGDAAALGLGKPRGFAQVPSPIVLASQGETP